ncbi:MAG: DUF2207 domain-containing protein [Gammaproteobacteria bacterium]|nr:DUF2207 domain-containing protein [Gammaproteobacteria bacterium]
MKRLAACFLLLSSSVLADERILDFHSDVLVMQDGWIEVTETIRVRAEGNRIRRGIYRDFPTEYRDQRGNQYAVGFQPLSVLRNNSNEDFHTQKIRDGKRVYFGDANRFLNNGEHIYRFRYRANRILGFFDSHDELYWNVTGVDWEFPIDSASATITFGFDVSPNELSAEAYTGAFGYTSQDYTSRIDASGRAEFQTTKPLAALNGLTIVVGWPKGYVDEPTRMQRLRWLLNDNANLLTAVIGLILLLAYYIPVWLHFGKDPEEGVLVTRYEPPDGFSPASLRYIRQMYYDDKVMTAAIVNLAVKGYLRIDVERGSDGFLGIGKEPDTYSLVQTARGKNAAPMAPGEQELYDSLFKYGNSITLENENHEKLGKAKNVHRQSLKSDYRHNYFRINGLMNIPPVIIFIVTAIVSLQSGPSAYSIAVIILMVITTVFFATIMKRPTLRGRKLLDEIIGFKDYLEVAEKDELNLRNPPEKTPALFEAYLPYALALGVEQLWSEKFASVLAAVQQTDGRSYQPTWYNGSLNTMNLSSATSQLSSSLNSAVSSSVAPPGSSSGGGGGGFSGGGGGGGGGGGW